MTTSKNIKVIARSKINASYSEQVFKIYKSLIKETRKEVGCISYELFEELENPNNLTLIEEWESLEALQNHTQTTHFIDYVGQLSEYESELPVLIYKKIF